MEEKKSPAKMLVDLILGNGKNRNGRIDVGFALKIASEIPQTNFCGDDSEESLAIAFFHALNALLANFSNNTEKEAERICEAIKSLLLLDEKSLEMLKKISSQANLQKGEEAYNMLTK